MRNHLAMLLVPFALIAACSDETVENRRTVPAELQTDDNDPVAGGSDTELAAQFALAVGKPADVEGPTCETNATQPHAPRVGFGSESYVSDEWKFSIPYGPQAFATRTFLYGPLTRPTKASPVLIYLPGYSGSSVGDLVYRDMMIHFARKGFYVIYVSYGGLFEPQNYEANAVVGIKTGLAKLAELQRLRLVNADPSNVIFAGHSLGGILTHRIVNRADAYRLPKPKALIAHDTEGENAPTIRLVLPVNDLRGVPAATQQFFISSETNLASPTTSNNTVAKLYHNAKAVPQAHKHYMVVPSDTHGCPVMLSDHYGMLSGLDWKVDAVDWWGYRRFTEAAIAYTLENKGAEFFTGSAPERTFLGTWSDGAAVKPLRIDVTVPAPNND